MEYVPTFEAGKAFYDKARKLERTSPNEALVAYARAAEEFNGYKRRAPDSLSNKKAADLIRDCLDAMDRINTIKTAPPKLIKTGEGDDAVDPSSIYKLDYPKESFNDVGGLEELKGRLEEAMIWPMVNPSDYAKYVGSKNEGVLLYGPPGCGKTYIVKAIAGEAKKQTQKPVALLNIPISSMLSKWQGDSEKNLRGAFKLAVQAQPTVLFFDELDAIGASRSNHISYYGQRLTNEFLAAFGELEGHNVLIVGATNLPWRIDAAVARTGRFNEKILVPPPDMDARIAVFQVYSKDKADILDKDVDFEVLAAKTDGYSSSDIKEICRKAGLEALRAKMRNKESRKISQSNFDNAIEKTPSSLNQWYMDLSDAMQREKVPEGYDTLEQLLKDWRARRRRIGGGEQ